MFDFNKVRCPFGERCNRRHVNKPKRGSTTATDGSNSSAIRALDVKMRRLTVQKAQLLAAQQQKLPVEHGQEGCEVAESRSFARVFLAPG